jgi:hypothetical protein
LTDSLLGKLGLVLGGDGDGDEQEQKATNRRGDTNAASTHAIGMDGVLGAGGSVDGSNDNSIIKN